MQNDLYIEALRSLKAAEADLEKKLENIRTAISSIEAVNSNTDQKSPSRNLGKDSQNGYNKSWSLSTKFLYVLKRENRFLHFREAGEFIAELDGKGDPKSIGRQLSSSTTKFKKEGTIVKIQATQKIQDTFWGSPKWLNEDGSIKEGNKYNEAYLSSKDTKSPLFEI